MIVIILNINISVFKEPAVFPNGTVNVTEGSDVTLSCSNPGNAGSPRYVWINDTDDNQLTALINQSPLLLSLTDVQRTASGDYICRSSYQDLPGVNRDTTVTINVQCKLYSFLSLFSSSYSHLIQTLITYYHSFSLFLSYRFGHPFKSNDKYNT